MKWYKKIILAIISMILIDCFVILALSMTIQNVIINGVVKETIYKQFSRKEMNSNNYISEEQINAITDDERLKELLNTKEMQELINKYVDITLESMTEEERIEDIKIEEDMFNYIKDNKEQISKIIGQEVTNEMIEKTREQLETREMSKSFKQTIKNTASNMTTREKTILKGYKVFVSNDFKTIIIGIILISVAIGIIILRSLVDLQKLLSRVLLSSGFTIEIICVVVKYIVASKANISTINMTPLIIIGLIYFGVGVLLRIIYEVIIKRRKQNEVS